MKRFLMRLFVIATCMFCITISTAFALPAGYTELEYLESSGTQYIDTGIVTPASSTTITKFEGVAAYTSSAGRQFIAAYDRYDYGHYCEFRNNHFGYNTSSYGDGGYYSPVLNVNTPYNVSMQINGSTDTEFNINVDGTNYSYTTTHYQGTTMGRFVLFRIDNAYKATALRLYSGKLSIDGTLVRDMIPARRDSDGVLGMYDTVTNTFFTNAGAGTFVAGPIAPNTKIATSSYVMGSYEYVDSTKQDVLTPSHITVTGASDGLMTSVTANNGHITVTKAEVSIPYYHDGTVTRLPIRVQ